MLNELPIPSQPPMPIAGVSTLRIGGLHVGNLSRAGWAQVMAQHCLATRNNPIRTPKVVFSVNGQVLAKQAREPAFKAMLHAADALDADGQPLVLASRLFYRKNPLPERVATTDFFHDAAAAAITHGLTFYLLGATEANLQTALTTIRARYPQLTILGARNGYFVADEESAVVAEIARLRPDVLWIGFGVPRQEAFVLRNREVLHGVGWVKTCGGLLDYFTPHIHRAPRWMQRYGLEWFFRTWQEPRKYAWRYATTNLLAAWLLLTRTGGPAQ